MAIFAAIPRAPGPLASSELHRSLLPRLLLVFLLLSFAACRKKESPSPNARANTAPSSTGVSLPGPRLAVIIDDLGYELASSERLFALPFHMTAAVLPNHPFSAQVAERANQRGFQVILHLPMESAAGDEKAEASELRAGMTPQEISRTLDEMLAGVPHAAGVNNHQGSRATADAALMRSLVAALRSRHLFLVDSRTSSDSVAYNSARAAGLAAANRTIFLDDVAAPAAIAAQLALAERQARERGWALAIGHPYRATLDVLTESLPGIEARDVRLVYACEVVE